MASNNSNNGVTITRLDSKHLRMVTGKDDHGRTFRVLVSYDTPIAYHTEGHDKAFTTTTNWSRTTNGHRSGAARAFGLGYGDAKDTPQDMCDWALEFLTGDKRLADTRPTTMGRKVNTRNIDYTAHIGIGDASLVVPVTRTRYR